MEKPTITSPEGSDELDGLERLIGRALLDADFRAYLLDDPAAAAGEAGLELTDYQLERLKSLNPGAIEVIAAGFEKGVRLDVAGATRLW